MKWSACKLNNKLQKWYIPLIIGALLIIVAIAIWSLPQLSISVLMLLFSLMLIGFGLRESLFIYANRRIIKQWGILLSTAILVSIIGLTLLFNPLLSLDYFNTLLVILLLGKAFQNFIFHYKYSRKTENTIGSNWIYTIALIIIAIAIIYHPKIVSSALVTLSGLPFFIIGICYIVLSMILRRSYKKLEAFKATFNTKDIDYEIID